MMAADPFRDLVGRAPRDSDSSNGQIAAVGQGPRRPNNRRQAPAGNDNFKRARTGGCDRCGRSTCTDPQRCPAKGTTCTKCGKSNHWAPVCRAEQGATKPSGQDPSQSQGFPWNGAATKSINACTVMHSAEIPIQMQSHFFRALTDAGADMSLVGMRALRAMNCGYTPASVNLSVADGGAMRILGKTNLAFKLAGINERYDFWAIESLTSDLILGFDFQRAFEVATFSALGHATVRGVKVRFLPVKVSPQLVSSATLPDFTISDAVTDAARAKLLAILSDGPFGTDARPIGCVDAFQHDVLTGNAKPIRSGLRSTSPKERDIVREELEKMMSLGVIRRSNSPWASAVVMVPKKDGTVRFCIDYRRLNEVTVKDSFLLLALIIC